jgi:hypothetical protein
MTQLTAPWWLHPNEVLDGALTGPPRDQFVPTAGELDAPPRVEDIYGFMSMSCIE